MHVPTSFFEWVCLLATLPFVIITPAFILAPILTGTVKPLIDDWIGMKK